MPPSSQHAALLTYSTTILLSAFLLFSLQPMFAKMVLPILGGAPAVWAVAMCFFQALLLAGYAWAHVLDRFVSARLGLILQLSVLVLALTALPIGLPVRAVAVDAGGTYLRLVLILAAGIGLPFFALAANAPLLQAWFSRLGHTHSANAYLLYAASNSGSLAALVAYPAVIEPLAPLRMQSLAWAAGFVLLGAAMAACGALALNARGEAAPTALPLAPLPHTLGARLRQRFSWAFLAFIPSGLLVAFTTYVTTDLASAPLLWVIPLALYLATFIAAFRERPVFNARVLTTLQPTCVALTLVLMEWDATFSWVLSCIAGTLAFTVTSLICHRELYERRPATVQLTEFYLWLSIGGAFGGMFCALLAPQIFTSVIEFPLLLGLGMLCRLGWRWQTASPNDWRGLLLAVATVTAVALLGAYFAPWTWTPALRLDAIAVLGVALMAALPWTVLEQAAALALILGVVLLPNGNKPVHVARSFYGTHKVVDPPGGRYRLLLHGVTLHGAERIADMQAAAQSPPLPLTYVHPSGPLARGVLLTRLAAGGPTQPLHVGIVGLGAGAMACHALAGDRWRFFELDAEVIRIATNQAYFTYLSRCQPGATIIAGDARLTLAKEPPGSFDYLVIDAFSSDAIPIHLLTVEAMQLYASLLAPRGVLAMHVSNQHFDLPPILESNLGRIPQLHGVYAQGETGDGAIRSQVVLIAREADILAPVLSWPNSRRLDAPAVTPWTDDYSNVIAPFIARLRAKWAQ
jgi:hypothetical protein